MSAYLLTVVAQSAPTSQNLLIPQLYIKHDMQVICTVTSAFPELSLDCEVWYVQAQGRSE